MIPFTIETLQSDHGPEFSKYFTKMVAVDGVAHRHSRVRRPNDNAHLEQFNRTIQDECISRLPRKLSVYQKEIPEYLRYYNEERPHMGLQFEPLCAKAHRFRDVLLKEGGLRPRYLEFVLFILMVFNVVFDHFCCDITSAYCKESSGPQVLSPVTFAQCGKFLLKFS